MYGREVQMFDIDQIAIGGAIATTIITMALLKFFNRKKSGSSTKAAKGAGADGGYNGVERRAIKRSAGTLYQRPDGSWVCR
jgi:hypothetical protein